MATLNCWNCGAALDDIPRPISRHANCPDCFNELHCCRLCIHFQPSIAAGQCDEERADPPVIKEGANFCDWFRPNPQAYLPDVTNKRDDARARLDALFTDAPEAPGSVSDTTTDTPDSGPLSKEDAAKVKLDQLFSGNDPSEKG